MLFSSTYWTILLCKILKNSYNRPRGCAIFGPKMGQFAKQKIFRKPVDKPSSYYSRLSTFQKSEISIY